MAEMHDSLNMQEFHFYPPALFIHEGDTAIKKGVALEIHAWKKKHKGHGQALDLPCYHRGKLPRVDPVELPKIYPFILVLEEALLSPFCMPSEKWLRLFQGRCSVVWFIDLQLDSTWKLEESNFEVEESTDNEEGHNSEVVEYMYDEENEDDWEDV